MRRVVVLYNTDYDQQPPQGTRRRRTLGRDASDVAAAAYDVRDGVAAYGFQAEIMGVAGHDLAECLTKLKKNPPDLVFNLTESLAQDSHHEIVMPSVLDMMGIPYTGSPAMALGLCLHKPKAKDILRARGVPTPASCTLERAKDAAGVDLPFPLFCKLAREDASVGIKDENVVADKRGLVRRVRELIDEFQQPVLVERYVEGRELYVTLLGYGDRVASLPFHEIDFTNLPAGKPRIVGYAAKWDEQSPEYAGTPSVQVKQMTARQKSQIEKTAIAAFRALELRDYGRVDFRISDDGIPYVIDVNPNCDISPGAGVSRAAAAAGMSYPQLIGRICEIAMERTANAHPKAHAA